MHRQEDEKDNKWAGKIALAVITLIKFPLLQWKIEKKNYEIMQNIHTLYY